MAMDESYFSSIVDTLKSVKKPGHFASGGEISLPLPALSLKSTPDVILGLPLSESQVETIIASASQAPYGKGEKTVVDTSVRRTWQLSPTQFFIKNSRWIKSLQTLLVRVKDELGCGDAMTVSCELYKLLLYESGGFFKVCNSS